MANDSRSGNGLIAALISVGVVGLLAVVLASVALGSRDSSGTTTPPAATTRPSIVMTGNGSATGIPNQLGFNLQVTLTRPDVATAMDDASREMKRVFTAIAGEGVERKDLQTTGLSIDPSYDYSGNVERLVGYTVTERARIQVRDLRKAGKTLSAAAKAGGNDVRINGVGLSIANRDALMAQARKAAVADAKAKAEAYAQAGGQHLGRVLSLKEVSAVAPQPVAYDLTDTAAYAGRALKSVPIRAGQKDLSVQIQVVWELD